MNHGGPRQKGRRGKAELQDGPGEWERISVSRAEQERGEHGLYLGNASESYHRLALHPCQDGELLLVLSISRGEGLLGCTELVAGNAEWPSGLRKTVMQLLLKLDMYTLL